MKKILLSLIVLFSVYSCDTEVIPRDTLVEENTYVTLRDISQGMNGAFRAINPTGQIAFNSIFTDMCKIGADSGGQQVTLYNMLLTAALNDQGIWASNYLAVNRANRMIRAIDNYNAPSGEVAALRQIRGQLIALRAYSHLQVFSMYTPNMEDNAGLSVPYIDYVNGPSDNLPRLTVGDFKTKLFEDLALAEELLSSSPAFSTSEPYYYFSAQSINFMRAKFSLYNGAMNDVLTFTSESLYPGRVLANATQYVNMFGNDTDVTEVIMKLSRRPQLDGIIGGVWYFTGTGGAFMEMSNAFYDELEDGDVRKSVNLDPDSNPSNNLHLIGKYLGAGGIPFQNDIKIMRYSDVVLMRAEAFARLSQYSNSLTELNKIVNARYVSDAPSYDYNTVQNALIDIVKERRIEFAYEGQRYIDLRRTKNITNLGIVRNPLDCTGAAPCSLPVTDHRYTLPIPLQSVRNNPNMIQNPGY